MNLRQLVIAVFAVSATAAMANVTSSLTDTSNVRELQQALKDKGYDIGTVDGKAGPQTKAALKKFQQAQSLTATGMLDQQTLAALGVNATAGASPGISTSTQGSTSASPSSTDASTSSTTTMAPSQGMKDQAPRTPTKEPMGPATSTTPQNPSSK